MKKYGGAYDIEDDMYFTREDIVDFGYDIAEGFSDWTGESFEVSDVYMDSPVDLHLELSDSDYNCYAADVKIDMRKIRKPSDIYKYTEKMLRKLKDCYIDYNGSDITYI